MLGALIIALSLSPGGVEPAQPSAPELPPGVEFIWDAPASCPDAATVTARVAALLGDRTFERRVSVIARVRREEDGMWDMRLYTVTPEGTRDRTLRHARCDLLAEATAIVVVVAVDPETKAPMQTDAEARALADADEAPVTDHEEPVHDEREEEKEEPGRGEVPDPTPPAGAVNPSERPPIEGTPGPRGFARVEGGFDLGMTETIAGSLALAAGITWPRVRAEVIARGVFPRAQRTSEGLGADIWAWTLGVRGCPVFGRKVQFIGCVGAEAGEILAEPIGLVDSRRGRETWVALGLAPMLAWSPHRIVAIVFGIEGVVALRRPAFDLADGALVYRAPFGAFRAGLGVEVRFP